MGNSSNDATIGAAISTVGNAAVAAASNKRQYKNQIKAMAQQQAYNKELWDYQNAYNTPQQQMERYEAAGLNPHLIYGSGAQASGNAGAIAPTEVPSEQAIRPDLPDGGDLMLRRLQMRQMDAQYQATTQNTANLKVRNMIENANAALKNLDLMKENYRSKNYEELAETERYTKQFIAKNAEAMLYSTQAKTLSSYGDIALKDQLHGFRSEYNKGQLDLQGKEIERAKLRITEQTLDNAFKENRNELAKHGIYQSDHPAMRLLATTARRMGTTFGELLDSGYENVQNLIDEITKPSNWRSKKFK